MTGAPQLNDFRNWTPACRDLEEWRGAVGGRSLIFWAVQGRWELRSHWKPLFLIGTSPTLSRFNSPVNVCLNSKAQYQGMNTETRDASRFITIICLFWSQVLRKATDTHCSALRRPSVDYGAPDYCTDSFILIPFLSIYQVCSLSIISTLESANHDLPTIEMPTNSARNN